MAAPFLKRKNQLAAKIESVPGTKETLAAADVVLISEAKFDPDIAMKERNILRATLSPMISIAGARMAKMSYACELVGSGTPGTAPYWGKLMKACGFEEAISTGVSVTYTPASDSIPTLTMELVLDGKIYRLWGARGNVKIDLPEVGGIGLLNFEFTGIDWESADASQYSGVSYPSTVPPVFMGVTFAIDSYAAVIDKLSIDMGNEVVLRGDAGADSGYHEALIKKRYGTVEFEFDDVLKATKNFESMWKTNAGVAMSLAMGETAGNIITITAPKVRPTKIGLADRDEIMTVPFTGELALNSGGDDELSIVLT